MKRKSTATNTLDSQLGRAMRKVLEQMEKSEERKEKSEERGDKSEGREAEDYRRGGKVRGPGTATSDSILARISNGEYILPKPAVDMVGANNLEAIRLEALRRSGVTPNAASPRDNMGRKKYLQGGAITGVGRYVAKNPEKALSMALGKVANVGTGYGGGLGMLLNSQDAVAPTMDVTKEKAYQRAYNAVQAGKGKKANLREWNITSNLIPPSNQEVLDRYNQQQAETDAMIRAQGGIAPSDRRALADMNRFNPRAYVPGYALGGLAFGGSGLNFQTPGEATATTFVPSTTVNPMTTGTAIGGGMRQSSAQPTGPLNQYGNDISLTNRMNAGTDQLRAMRTGLPAATPTTPQQSNLQQPDFMTGLKSLLNPQQQAQDAYKAARGRADALDVASGRFDREYAPGFKYGGMVGQNQWEWLPRFADGGGLSLVPLADEGYRQWQAAQQAAQQAREAATPMQSRLPLRGGSQTVSIEPLPSIPQQQPPVTPKIGFSTTPPLPGVMPSGQPELPKMPGGPASKAPIPFERKPAISTPLGLEPKGLPLPKEVPYVSPKSTGLSLASENVIDYRPQSAQRPFVNVSTSNTPAQLTALKQQAETMAAKLNITPQEAMQRMTAMQIEPIETVNKNVPTGRTISPSGFGTGVAGGLGLGLASENLAPATGMLTNIASNYFSTPLGLMDAAKLGYEQAKYDEMTSEGRAQYYPTGRPSYQPAVSQTSAMPIPGGAVPVSTSPSVPQFTWRGDVPESPTLKSSTPIPKPHLQPLPPRQPMEERWSALTGRPAELTPYIGGSPAPAKLSVLPKGMEGATNLPGTDVFRSERPGLTQYGVLDESAMGGGPGQATFQGARQPGGNYALRDGTLVRLGDKATGGSLGYVGTPETKGMTQAEATAYNVANLNRQYEALKSRNEAYGLGGGNVGSALPAAPAPVDIWARPGDSFGDSQMRQAQYESLLNNAGQQRGVGAKRRAAAMIDAAQALVAPGLAVAKMNADQAQEQARGLMGLKTAELQTQASERQKAIEAQLAQQAAEQAQQNWQYERDQADRQKAQDLAVRLYGQQARNQTRPAMLPEKDISGILARYSTPAVPGQPATVDLDKLHGDYNVAPLPTDRSKMQAGQVYYDPSDPASPYKISTPQGIRKLGARRDLIIYGHMTNPAARSTFPAGKADEEG